LKASKAISASNPAVGILSNCAAGTSPLDKLEALDGSSAILAFVIVLSSISADVIVVSAITPPTTFVNVILRPP
jgi:hypothetical protein